MTHKQVDNMVQTPDYCMPMSYELDFLIERKSNQLVIKQFMSFATFKNLHPSQKVRLVEFLLTLEIHQSLNDPLGF